MKHKHVQFGPQNVQSFAYVGTPEGVAVPLPFASGTQELASNMNNYFCYTLCGICTDTELLSFLTTAGRYVPENDHQFACLMNIIKKGLNI